MASVGGQALIEGVMMQNGGRVAVAVRRTNDNEIVVRDLHTSKRLRKLGEIPFVRGLFRLYDMLSLGIRALNMSARIAFPDQEEEMSSGWSVLMIGIVGDHRRRSVCRSPVVHREQHSVATHRKLHPVQPGGGSNPHHLF